MAVQIIPLVAAIVGGAVTIGAGVYVYNNSQSKPEEEVKTAIVEPQKLLNTQENEKPKAPEAKDDKPQLPTIGLLSVEKDGSVLIAGNAEADSTVEIVQGDQVLGQSKSAGNGDFVVVFDKPLKPGNYELYVRSIGKNGNSVKSEEAAIVSLPDDGSEHLAMVSKPAGPSKLIQVSKLDEKQEKQVVKGDRPQKAEEKKSEVVETAKQEETQKSAEQKAASVAQKEEVKQPETGQIADAKEQKSPEQQVAKVEEKVEQKIAEAVEKAEQKTLQVAKLADETEKNVAQRSLELAKPEDKTPAATDEKQPVAKSQAETAIKEVKELASVDPKAVEPEEQPEPKQVQPVFLEAVEVEDSKVFVAGTGEPGHAVNIYINDKYIGSTTVNAGGTFLLESESSLAFGNHVVRADMLSAGTSKVAARAEVPLIHEQPAEEKRVVVADAGNTEAKSNQEKNAETVKQPEAVEKQVAQKVEETKTAVEQKVAGVTQETRQQVEVARLEDKFEKPAAEVLTRNLAKPDQVEAKAEEGKQPSKTTDAASKVVAEEVNEPVKAEEKTVAAAEPVKQQETVKKAEAKQESQQIAALEEEKVAKAPKRVIRTGSSVIIRRGDNLWRISRRILGRGIRYSTIYQANKDQIRNPHLIFPGQIFKVPEKMVNVNSSERS